jgi:hypothetical protein
MKASTPLGAAASSMTPARSLPCPDGNVDGEDLRHRPRADDRLTDVDAGRLHPDQDLPVPGHRAFHLVDPQHFDAAELVVPDCLWHDLCISLRLESPGSTPGGLAHVNPLLKISCREAGLYQGCRQAG